MEVTTLIGPRTLHYVVDALEAVWFPLSPTSKLLLTKPRNVNLLSLVHADARRSATPEEAEPLWLAGVMSAAGKGTPVLVSAAGLIVIDALERCL